MQAGFRADTQAGYTQIIGAAVSTALTVPDGATLAIIRPETQGVRWRMDGGTLSSTIGYPLYAGEELQLTAAQLVSFRMLELSATATINVHFFK